MSEFTTYLEIAGCEVVAHVTGDYQPEEPMTHNYPGCAASADIGGVLCTLNGGEEIDVLPLLDKEALAALELELMEHEATNYHAKRLNFRFTNTVRNIALEERENCIRQTKNQRGTH